jgi:peptidoglycan/xylan/chitin deacetylase (PgdA/CDA1 family)
MIDFSWRRSLAGAFLVAALLCSCGREEEEEVPEEDGGSELSAILEDPDIFKPVEETDEVPVAEEFILNKAAQVSVLCYHDFTEGAPRSKMELKISEFEEQMQAIRDSEIPVIKMSELLAWLRGDANIPDPCIVITFDDGWKAVHTLAMPVLKKYEFPYTVFLYKNYVDVGGRSLSRADILELIESGAEVGSHSVSHKFLTQSAGKNQEQYEKWVEDEMVVSRDYLKELLGVPPVTFAYPYGAYNDLVMEKGEAAGYEALFTVNGQRVSWEVNRAEIGRFVVYPDDPRNFQLAMSFRGTGGVGDSHLLTADKESGAEPLVTTSPAPEEKVQDRSPLITVDLSKLGEVVEGSLSMRISGYGQVPVEYDPVNKIARFQIQRTLRNPTCVVQLSVSIVGGTEPYVIPWRFFVDQDALYLHNPPIEDLVESE